MLKKLISLAVAMVLLFSFFACRPAPQIPANKPSSHTRTAFELSGFTLSPTEVASGQYATASVDVSNVGEVAGAYTAILKVDGVERETREVTVAVGAKEKVTFKIAQESVGIHLIEIGRLTGELKVLRPATFELAQLVITPEKVIAGRTVTVRVSIKNVGEVEGSHRVILRMDGEIAQTKDITLAPGTTETAEFALAAHIPGTHHVEFNGLGKSFLVLSPVVVTAFRAQESLDETPYISINVDGVDSRCNVVVRVTQTNLPVSAESYMMFRGQHVAFYMPEEAAGIGFGQVIREYNVVGATDVAYLLQEELTGVVPFHGTVQHFIGEPGESGGMRVCGANGNPIRLGYNVSEPPPHNNCIREPEGHPHWGVMWHEMGHNFTLTPVRFLQLYGGGSGAVQLVYCETMASLALVYAQERVVSEPNHLGLGDFTVTSIGGRNYGALLFNKENSLRDLANYEASQAHFTELDNGQQIAALHGMLTKLGETYGWDIFPRFFKIFLPAEEPWDLFDQADTETKKHTVTVCALSIAADTDLRKHFTEWNFPIDEAFYQQIKAQIEAAILN